MTAAEAIHVTDQLGAAAADAGFLPGVMSMLGRFVEADRDELEEVISRGLETFREVGMALFAIRERKLYRTTHGTFEAYCLDRWSFTDRRARQLIDAAEIGTVVPVQNEAQARALAPLADEPEAMQAAWAEASEATEGKPTAEAIRQAVEQARADRQAIRDLNALAPDDYDHDADVARMERIQPVFRSARTLTALGDPTDLTADLRDYHAHHLPDVEAAADWLARFVAAWKDQP